MTFTERCRNQEEVIWTMTHFLVFVFFFLMDQIWATCPMIKEREGFRKWSNCSRRPAQWKKKPEKGFASGLIVPGDLLDRKNKTRKGFREWSNCSRRPAR